MKNLFSAVTLSAFCTGDYADKLKRRTHTTGGAR